MLVDIKEFQRRLLERLNDPTVADEKWFADNYDRKVVKRPMPKKPNKKQIKKLW